MIYHDGIHMVADSLEELHSFAQSVGIKRCWFEGTKKGHPHYDVVGWRLEAAVNGGATKIGKKELLALSKRMLAIKEFEAKIFKEHGIKIERNCSGKTGGLDSTMAIHINTGLSVCSHDDRPIESIVDDLLSLAALEDSEWETKEDFRGNQILYK